jgi:hemolysin D
MLRKNPSRPTRLASPSRKRHYRALINLSSGHLESQGRHLRLVPGMLVNAEIHLGTRTVLEYLLSPIQKVAHDAGRER